MDYKLRLKLGYLMKRLRTYKILIPLFMMYDFNPIMRFKLLFNEVTYFDPFDNTLKSMKKELSKPKKKGISGFMRLRNEEDYVEAVVEACITHIDELIIVYNDCTDSTPKIIKKLQKKYPSKIKLFEYEPVVYPQGSEEYKKLPPNSKHSLVNYYNFSLAQVSYNYAVKIDGDDFLIPELLEKKVQYIKQKQPQKYLVFAGINLWSHQKKIFVQGSDPFAGGLDRGFFPVKPHMHHFKGENYEVFYPGLHFKSLGILYFHLKGMKQDRGLSNYEFKRSNNEFWEYVMENQIKEDIKKLELTPFEKFKKEKKLPKYVPNPEKLNIPIYK